MFQLNIIIIVAQKRMYDKTPYSSTSQTHDN